MREIKLDPAFCEAKCGKGRAVSMNEHAEASLDSRIYTVGLCGCRCTVAKRGETIQLALWVPGEWIKRGERYVMEPNSTPPDLLEMCADVYGYSELATFGIEQMVDFNAGRVFAFGEPVPQIAFTAA